MNHERNELRKVTLKNGQVGYFHTWTQTALQIDDDKVIGVTAAVVELEDGVVVVIDPTEMTLDRRSVYQRNSDEALERRTLQRRAESDSRDQTVPDHDLPAFTLPH